MPSNKSKGITDWAGIVKWIVIGVIALCALFLFKGEIGKFIGKAEVINISKDGIEIKTAQTPLGKTNVSNVSLNAVKSHNEGIEGNVYVSSMNKFQITWPSNEWNADENMGESYKQQLGLPSQLKAPLVIVKNALVDNFRPNVNVVIEPIANMSIKNYMNLSINGFKQQGWQLLSSDIDEATQGGFISFYNNSSGSQLYQFQKIVIANGNAYVITASQLPPGDSFSDPLKEELLSILNSFRTLN